MPEHLGKKKTAIHNSNSNTKASAHQEDHGKKEKAEEQQDEVRPTEEIDLDGGILSHDDSKSTEQDVEEAPVIRYDAMRVEPVLTKLIVEGYEGDADENGFFEGEGTVHFVGGHVYKGLLKNKKMNGHGVYFWADGTTYSGDFSDNSICGKGVYSWPDGSRYEGDVKNGFRHGTGTYRCGTCPSTYIGEWEKGLRHGKGVLYFDEKFESYFDGVWERGNKCGFGIHKYKSGNIYEGQWLNNIRHGRGIMHWFDKGEEYDGDWVDGIQHGKGKYTWYSKRVVVSQYPIRNKYTGDFVHGQREGFGVFYYASGAKYSGQWVKNVKSGTGEFMFKNGSVFKGTFENDHIVDFPDLMPSRMTTPDIAESGLPVRSQTPMQPHSAQCGIGSVDAVLDINLKEIFVTEGFDIDRQQIEIEEVARVVLRYMTPIKHIYKFYSTLGTEDSNDNTFVLNRMKFWRFLKDCTLHTVGHSLAEINQVDGITETLDDPHDRHTAIFMRDFVNVLINVAFLLFKDDFSEEESAIARCFTKMLTQFVLPNACIMKGHVYSIYEKMKEADKYIERCAEVFRYFREVANKEKKEHSLRIREFLWMLKDFKLLNAKLNVSKFLEIVYNEDQQVLEERSFNLDDEIVFLEFVESLLQCGQVFDAEEEQKREFPGRAQNPSVTEVKSPIFIKDEDESTIAEKASERLKTPSNIQSPDKGTTVTADTVSVPDQAKVEPTSPTVKTQESSSHGKASAAGGSRRDQHAGKESVAASASRGRRRGTADHVEVEGKFGSASKAKEKGNKDRLKNGTKSAKKVVIEDEKSSPNVALQSQIELESENQSILQLGLSTVDTEASSNLQIDGKHRESEFKPTSSHVLVSGTEDSPQVIEDGLDQFQDPSTLMQNADNGKVSVDATETQIEEIHQTWAKNLHSFFEEHFFPAFENRIRVDQALAQKRIYRNETVA